MERVDLTGFADLHVTRQFASSGGAIIRAGTVGELWFAWHSRRGGWIFHYERAMADHADKWLTRGGTWTEVEPDQQAFSLGTKSRLAAKTADAAP